MDWKDRGKGATAAAHKIAKALAPSPTPHRGDPWLDALAHQREVNRLAERRWIPRRPRWLR